MTGFVRGEGVSDSEGGDDCARDERRDRGANHDGDSVCKSSREFGYCGGVYSCDDAVEDFRKSGEKDRLR